MLVQHAVQHTVRLAMAGEMSAHYLRQVAHGAACSSSDAAWAFAIEGQTGAVLFEALARAAELQVRNFDAQGLANTAWAFATVGYADGVLFRKALCAISGVSCE